MIHFSTLLASIKRNLLWILGICMLAVVASLALDKLHHQENPAVSYQAQASVHYTVDTLYQDAKSDGSEFDYLGAYVVNSVSRIIESNEVAGEVRRQMGDDRISVQQAVWKNSQAELANSEFATISAFAPTKEEAVLAADKAAELTIEQMQRYLSVKNLSISSPAQLVNSQDGSLAFNFGTQSLKDFEPSVSSGISKRRLLIFIFLALFGSTALFVAKDLLSRRAYTPEDLERLSGIPSLYELKAGDIQAWERAAYNLRAVMRHEDLNEAALLGICAADKVDEAHDALAPHLAQASERIAAVGSLDKAQGLTVLEGASAVVLLVRSGAARGSELANAVRDLSLSGKKVLGCIFVKRS